MPLDKEAVLAEIDEVLARCGASKDRPFVRVRRFSEGGFSGVSIDGNEGQIAASCLACIERNAPQRSYVEQAERLMERGLGQKTLNQLLGILVGVRQDIEAGYITTLEQRAREVVLDDLLEAATEIEEIHPAPAIVLAVSVLEEHVRKLAEARDIETVKTNGRFRSFEAMTNDLRKADVISLPEDRQLGGWYAQRTEAAHGRFDNVTADEAPRIIDGVRDFIVRHPS